MEDRRLINIVPPKLAWSLFIFFMLYTALIIGGVYYLLYIKQIHPLKKYYVESVNNFSYAFNTLKEKQSELIEENKLLRAEMYRDSFI